MYYRNLGRSALKVSSLVATGHASTPGYSDPAYPIEGRRVG